MKFLIQVQGAEFENSKNPKKCVHANCKKRKEGEGGTAFCPHFYDVVRV